MTPTSHESKYRAKTKKSEEHIRNAREHLPAGVESNIRLFSPHPFVVSRAKGAYLYDIDGNKIIDYALGYGPMILGHTRPEVIRAVKEQSEKGTVFGAPSEISVDYVKLVKKAMPSIELFRFTNSGTEATMHPLRVARGYSGKEKIAKAEGSYHGGYDYMMQSVDITADKLVKGAKCQPAVTWGKGVPECMSDLAVIYPFNEWDETEDIIRKNADELAAVMLEPVHAGGGCVLPRDGYIKKMRKLTKELGITLIFDEVMTGFRLAFGGGEERYDVKPDLTCIAKICGGGYPLGGFGGKREIMEEIVPNDDGNVYHGGSYNAHAVSVAAGFFSRGFLGFRSIATPLRAATIGSSFLRPAIFCRGSADRSSHSARIRARTRSCSAIAVWTWGTVSAKSASSGLAAAGVRDSRKGAETPRESGDFPFASSPFRGFVASFIATPSRRRSF